MSCKTWSADVVDAFERPPEAARPWAFWYWMHGAVSREGVSADLQAMREAGLGGAYLMPLKGPLDPPLREPNVVQLSPEFWEMVRFAASEADRAGLGLAMHACDGFAVAGGPWITPELSMQKVVWTTTHVAGGRPLAAPLAQPQTNESYYREIAVLAFPSLPGAGISTRSVTPKITTNAPDVEPGFLIDDTAESRLRSENPCWIVYEFAAPFTCRAIEITRDGPNYQANRLRVEASDDGRVYRRVADLQPPRHGWQDQGVEVTHGVPTTTARYFRFSWDKAGSEPGGEDLDSAKWSPVLKIRRIHLLSEPRIHQFAGKSGAVWRVGARDDEASLPAELCVDRDKIIDVSEHLLAGGSLDWTPPAGKWTIMRFGCTSTGARNATAGGGMGLECDKFNPEAARMQFDRWFGEARRRMGEPLAARVLKTFHIDSWECGSQNWSPAFREEFNRRRGYDATSFLPAWAGIPVDDGTTSEQFLYDVRQTIVDLTSDAFFVPLAKLARDNKCLVSAECTAPTMCGDALRHFAEVDVPMGEFWLESPTHDKPNDMRDAVSAGHAYGKSIIQAEAFTQLRMQWDETPASLKTLGDRNLCLGANRLVFHVCAHNPFVMRRPGVTLDGIGVYFQRDQTWWPHVDAWVEYLTRCQAMLQLGRPVVDVAVFTGNEIPRRAATPEQLVDALPGLIGARRCKGEHDRRANLGQPMTESPPGVKHVANLPDPADWLDPLRGYAYDSVTPDALRRLVIESDGRLGVDGGAAYAVVALLGERPMDPSGQCMSADVAEKLLDWVQQGGVLIVMTRPTTPPGLKGGDDERLRLAAAVEQLWPAAGSRERRVGKGRVIQGPFVEDSLEVVGVARDFDARDATGKDVDDLAWTHRATADADIYFVSNQSDDERHLTATFRASGNVVEVWDPVDGSRYRPIDAIGSSVGVTATLDLGPRQALFVVVRRESSQAAPAKESGNSNRSSLAGKWEIEFPGADGAKRGALVDAGNLFDWATSENDAIRYFSGVATYRQTFSRRELPLPEERVWIDLGMIYGTARVRVNNRDCGVAWTAPYRVEITAALRAGENQLAIEV
ncbi:MAG: hypothetical protein KDA61_20900, partial [Planctomycetales bacterium]|nr:hypothetical protein [Planctomycetales bacterium]